MNALGDNFEAMKQLLTNGSRWRYLGSDALLKIGLVRRSSHFRSRDLQNLCLLTNLGYTSFPPEFGAPLSIADASASDSEESPTPLPGLTFLRPCKDAPERPVSLAETDTSPHELIESEKPPRPRIHFPKAKKKQPQSRPVPPPVQGRPPYTQTVDTKNCCEVCHWIFPNDLEKDAVQLHREQAAAGLCRASISEYRETQRESRRQEAKRKASAPEARAWYGGVRVCPHCQLGLDGGFPVDAKKEHIEECRAKRRREEEASRLREEQESKADSPLDPFALSFSTLLRKDRLSFSAPSN